MELATHLLINLMRGASPGSDLIYGGETTFQIAEGNRTKASGKGLSMGAGNGSWPQVRMFSYSAGRGAQHGQKLYIGVKSGTVRN